MLLWSGNEPIQNSYIEFLGDPGVPSFDAIGSIDSDFGNF